MRCVHPLTAWKTSEGRILFNEDRSHGHEKLQLPCGQCIECKLERTRQWAVRIIHEAQLHDSNYFATLTYNDESLPRTLHHHHFQTFMKRLRFNTNQKIRYFMCGEYGDNTRRPHYHAILFGLTLTDKTLHSERQGRNLYTSKTLEDTWQLGYVTIGEVNFQTASYVASYCTKKITGEKATAHYERLDHDTGEIYSLTPEYSRMSLKPGIAHAWITKYTEDVYAYDHVIVNGREQKPPRYYDKYLEQKDATRLNAKKIIRQQRAQNTKEENKPNRLKARETVTKARHNQRTRTL